MASSIMMAQLNFEVTNAGLSVPVWLGLDGETSKNLLTAGQPVPPPLKARGLLDTGCDVTAVAAWVLQALAIPVHSPKSSHTAGGQVEARLYKVSFSITDPNQPASSPWLTEPTLLVMELPANLPDTDVLVGLDVLLGCHLHLDGPARKFTLAF